MVRGVCDADVVDKDGVVAERRVDVLAYVGPLCRQRMAEVADAERPLRRGSLGPIIVEGAHHPAIDVEVAVAASHVAVQRIQGIDPLCESVLTPELRVAVIEGVRFDTVVSDLAPGVVATRQFGLIGQWI